MHAPWSDALLPTTFRVTSRSFDALHRQFRLDHCAQWRPRLTCPLNRVILLPLTTGGSARPGAASQAISKLSTVTRIAGFLPSRGHARERLLRCGLMWAERQNAANPGLVQDGGAEHGELQRGV